MSKLVLMMVVFWNTYKATHGFNLDCVGLVLDDEIP